MRQLVGRFGIKAGPKELVAATRRAIADATHFNPREMNTNFDYDHDAYRQVKANFGELCDLIKDRVRKPRTILAASEFGLTFRKMG